MNVIHVRIHHLGTNGLISYLAREESREIGNHLQLNQSAGF